MAVSYLYGWNKPIGIGNSGPLIVRALRKILQRYALAAADRGGFYCPVDTSILQHSITAQPDMTEVLLWWIGSPLPYMAKIEFLWRLGLPYSKNHNPNASSHPLARGINDIKRDFSAACRMAVRGEWAKI